MLFPGLPQKAKQGDEDHEQTGSDHGLDDHRPIVRKPGNRNRRQRQYRRHHDYVKPSHLVCHAQYLTAIQNPPSIAVIVVDSISWQAGFGKQYLLISLLDDVQRLGLH